MIDWNILKHSNCVCCLALYDHTKYDTAFNMCDTCKYNNDIIQFHYTYEEYIEHVRNQLKEYMCGKPIDNDYYAICNILIKYRLNVSFINKKIRRYNIHVVCSERYNDELLTKRCIFQIFKCNLFEKLNNNMLSSIMNGKMI